MKATTKLADDDAGSRQQSLHPSLRQLANFIHHRRHIENSGAIGDVIATAYERSSIMVTTNLPFENWTEVLGSERLTGATLDRLTHRCKIIETKGESYRLQDAAKRSRIRKS